MLSRANITVGGVKTKLTALQSGKLAAFTQQKAAAGPFGLPRWALPVGAVALVGAVAFFMLRKKGKKR
jgi:hypothetical protein